MVNDELTKTDIVNAIIDAVSRCCCLVLGRVLKLVRFAAKVLEDIVYPSGKRPFSVL